MLAFDGAPFTRNGRFIVDESEWRIDTFGHPITMENPDPDRKFGNCIT
jgi:hypothetical protein